jgi:pilus assembly protein CpaE
MAHISAIIRTTDPDFRAHVSKLLRTSGLPISVMDEKHLGGGAAPDLGVVDIRSGAMSELAQFRTAWPAAAIFAVAAKSEPDLILEAMRAGANEFLAWPGQGAPPPESLFAALKRTVDRAKTQRGSSRSGTTLTFFGAKGGCGTTTLAVNCAIEIARITKKPAVIIDLHPFIGEVALFLGLRPRFSVVDAIDNLHRLDQQFMQELVVKHKTGLDVLAGSDQPDRPGTADVPGVEHLLQTLRRSYEYIVIDAGSISIPCAEVAVSAADTIYLVANPDVASVRNTHRVASRIEQLGAGKERLRILLNRLSEFHEIAPKQIESALGYSVHMAFPSDYNTVSTALNSGVPLTLSNHTEIAAQLTRLTRQIVQLPDEIPEPAAKPKGLFLGIF